MSLKRQAVPVLDVDATPLAVDGLMDVLQGFVDDGVRRVVVGHNLHSVTLCHSDQRFRAFYDRADVVLIDGAPVLWLWCRGRKLDRPATDYRLGSTDWIPALGTLKGLQRIAVIGAGADANAGAVRRLQEIVPGAEIHGIPGEGWNDALEAAASGQLKTLRPQLVFLGLGMPLQEEVLQRWLPTLPPATYCTVGGAIEQLAGVQKLAPRWLGRLGLEWAWRLALHPGRVAYRVFGEPWVLLGLLARRRLRRG
ncbi:WecB/TagA/CpsF family glycosyltransferase [Pseudarthrobacter sp. J47]|uniref:WecB/TagA/CpsF family glycosyltransferase n=1 Tax=Pseudarthrobacter sp. J47 TaxID=3116482 RepID=UPI002E807152|nr:WecB/TagA/CpsF family glycosyltransferase [Pseudarthrobacter sp. J47]MEE2521462.1 WecB/TagA/CpsF family glycosyltransferase [Pseudarthrobacter sp. J47]